MNTAPDTKDVRYESWLDRVRSLSGYDVLRIVLGLVLLIAGVLKGHQLATVPPPAEGVLSSWRLLFAVVGCEFVLAVWLLSGAYPRESWWMALACFTVFTLAAGYKATTGVSSCGCFGRLPVPPRHMLVFDVAILAALATWRPSRWLATTVERRRRVLLALAVVLAIGLPGMFLVWRLRPHL